MKTNRMEETKVEETIDIKTTNGNISETVDITTIETTPKATQRNREQKQVIEETLILETETKQHHKHHHHHHHEHHQKKNGEVIEEILIEETESTKRHHHKHHHHHHHEEIKEVIEETIPAPPQTSPPFLTPTEDLEAEVIWKPQAYWVPPQVPTSPVPSTTSTDELAGVAWQAEFNLNNPEAVESTPSTTSSSPTGLDQRPLSKVGETVQMLESIQATILPPKPLMKSWLNFSNSRSSLMLQTQVIEETEEITPVSSPGIEEEDLTKVEQTVKILDELEESLQSTMPPSPPPGWLDDSEEDEEDILEISAIPVVQQGISSPSPTPSPPAQGLGPQEFHSRQNQLLHLLIPRPKLEQKELVVETEEVEESLESSTSQNPPSSQLEIVQTELIVESSQSTSSAGPSQVQIGLNLEGSPPAAAETVQTGLNSEGPPYAPGGTMQMVPNLPNSLEQMGPNTEGPPTAPAGIVETELIVESLETTPTPTPRPSPATQRTMKTELQLPLTRPTSVQTGPNLEIEQTQLIVESLESTPSPTPTPTPPPSPTNQRILKAGLNLPLTSSNSTKQMEQTELIVESLESTPTPTPLPVPLPFPLPIPLSSKPQTLPLEVVQTELIVNRTAPPSQSLQQAEFIAELNSIVQPPSPSPTVEVVETVYVEDSSNAQPTLEVVETELIVTPVLVGELALDSSDKLGKRYSVSAALAESALEQQQPQQPEVPEKRKICCNCRCIIA